VRTNCCARSLRLVPMVDKNLQDSSLPHWPEAAQTLMALMHAQGEVARLSEREQLFSSLLVSVNAVLWAFNWETRQVLYVSPAYERIFGRPAGLVLADFNEWRDAIYPDDLEYAERSLAEVLVKGAVEDREYRIIAADGQIRWLSDNASSTARMNRANRSSWSGSPKTLPKRSCWKASCSDWQPPMC
jgi:PAS domain-containing protein